MKLIRLYEERTNFELNPFDDAFRRLYLAKMWKI